MAAAQVNPAKRRAEGAAELAVEPDSLHSARCERPIGLWFGVGGNAVVALGIASGAAG